MENNIRKKALSVVFMPTLACNCTCDYCFQAKVGDEITMSDETVHLFFDNLIAYCEQENIRLIKMFWQGGDVLSMKSERAEQMLEIIGDRMRPTDITVINYIQTNLLGYDEKWRHIFKTYFKDSISSSLDYPNLYRKTAKIGVDDYNTAWRQKKEDVEKDGFSVSVISLVNDETFKIGAENFYSYYKDEVGLKSLQINFPFPGQDTDYAKDLNADVYARFIEDLHSVWEKDNKHMKLRPFVSLEQKMSDHFSSSFCIWSYSCADDIVSIAPNGDVAQCDCWILNYDEYKFGNIKHDSLINVMQSKNRELFYERAQHLALNTGCGDCEYWSICHGGCPIRSLSFNDNFMDKDHFCAVYKKLFDLFKY